MGGIVMSNNRISKCFWMQAKMCLVSPLAMGDGKAEHTDSDIQRRGDGKPYIPGSSIAGVVRSLIKEAQGLTGEQLKTLFGDDTEQHRQSMVYFWDGDLEEDSQISVRDGIEINERTKTAKNRSKYDFEVLNPGAVFRFRMEIVLREEFKELPVEQFVRNLLACVEKGDFRIGAKTSRGYGKFQWKDIRCEELKIENKEDMEKYVKFDWEQMKKREWDDRLPASTYQSAYTTIEVPLEAASTLLIRSYFLQNFDVDCEQMTVGGRAVIPGSAWAGIFRHKVMELLTELGDRNMAAELTSRLFGAEKDSDNREKSRILFEESVDSRDKAEEKFIKLTRNKIDRFTGGVLKTALFSERVGIGGEFLLSMKIREPQEYEIGLLLLAIEELRNGMMAVGGTTSVGRGEMRGKDGIFINGKKLTEESEQKYWNELQGKLKSRLEE